MGAKPGSQAGGAGAVFFVLLLLLAGVVVHYFWWIAGAAALVGLFFAGRALLRATNEQRAEAEDRAAELAYRAAQQDRWTSFGDSRGIYGSADAELMRIITPKRVADPSASPDDGPQIAAVARTPQELDTLVADRLPGWRWAVFASVLVQRRAEVQSRLRDCQLGYAPSQSPRAVSGPEVAHFVTTALREVSQLIDDVEAFMLAPGFMGSFGEHFDESTADPDAVMHIANRLMDYHERLLALTERCCAFGPPTQYAQLRRDCATLMNIPLDGYRRFIEEFVAVVDHLPDYLHAGDDTVEIDPVLLHLDVDDALFDRIIKQVQAAAKS